MEAALARVLSAVCGRTEVKLCPNAQAQEFVLARLGNVAAVAAHVGAAQAAAAVEQPVLHGASAQSAPSAEVADVEAAVEGYHAHLPRGGEGFALNDAPVVGQDGVPVGNARHKVRHAERPAPVGHVDRVAKDHLAQSPVQGHGNRCALRPLIGKLNA